MYYTVRSAGSRSTKDQIQFYLLVTGQIIKVMCTLLLLFFGFMAWITGNYGALAFLFIIFLLSGLSFNFFGLRTWLPGWRKGSWFTRSITLTIYLFMALAILLFSTPFPL